MLPLLTFVAAGSIGWFTPVPLYPDAKASICGTNLVPSGTALLLHAHEKNATCRVVGKLALKNGIVMTVSQAVRDELGGFKSTQQAVIFKFVGSIPECPPPKYTPKSCELPPGACIVEMPGEALVVCLKDQP